MANQVSLSKHGGRSRENEDKDNGSIKQSETTDRSFTLLELAEAHKSHVLRFVDNIKSSHSDPRNSRVGPLQPEEISAAETFWIARAQRDLPHWRDRFNDLAPLMDGTIIRVGGRLKKSQLDYDQKHPVLLSSSNHISQLIMEDVHRKVLHAGPERTRSESRRKFWIVRGRRLAKKLVRDCAVCRKLRQQPLTTLIADLPPERVLPFSPPFSVTGGDLFGPFN